MYPLNLYQAVIFLLLFHVSHCQRRIVNGDLTEADLSFVVYIVKANVSPEDYDEWLCGGALVTYDFIITSAACLEDVKFMYAIAGYKKYVPDAEIDTNDCTNKKKKKITYTCVPKSYELNYERLAKWSFIDIGVAQLESPIDHNDAEYDSKCSYLPKPIQVNYEEKYQAPATDAMVLGWGHKEIWRQESDTANHNQQDLHYASVLLAEKEECKKEYTAYPEMNTVIDKYMICSMGPGNIDSKGEMKTTSAPTANGCARRSDRSGSKFESCEDVTNDQIIVENTRKTGDNNTKFNKKTLFETDTNNTIPFGNMNTRRQGICQNDHGGPIVTWVGGHAILIGVASVFKVSSEWKCEGPYLYTSTQCNGAFLNCILTSNGSLIATPILIAAITFVTYAVSFGVGSRNLLQESRCKRRSCDSPAEEKGYKTVETNISWVDHPDGPSDKDRHLNLTSNKFNSSTTASSTNLNNTYSSTTASSINLNKSNSSTTASSINLNKSNSFTTVTSRNLHKSYSSTTATSLNLINTNSSTTDSRINLNNINSSTTASSINLKKSNSSTIDSGINLNKSNSSTNTTSINLNNSNSSTTASSINLILP